MKDMISNRVAKSSAVFGGQPTRWRRLRHANAGDDLVVEWNSEQLSQQLNEMELGKMQLSQNSYLLTLRRNGRKWFFYVRSVKWLVDERPTDFNPDFRRFDPRH